MRLFHVALIVSNSHQTALRNALRSISTEYREYDWVKSRERGEDTSRELLQAVEEFQPDVVFMQLQDPTVLQPSDAAQISATKIVWNGDVRNETQQWMYDLGRVVDLSLFTNMRDVRALQEAGINTDWMDIGFDPMNWTPSGSRNEKWPDVVYLASNFGDSFPLSQYRRGMVARLAERFGDRFGCYGHGWGGPSTYPLIEIEQEAECLRSTKIAINLSHFCVERYSSDRLLRSLGCGPLVLTHRYPRLEKDWRDGTDLITWNDLDDLCEKIQYFLNEPEIRVGIAEMGCAKAHRDHTWEKRIQTELLPRIQSLTAAKM